MRRNLLKTSIIAISVLFILTGWGFLLKENQQGRAVNINQAQLIRLHVIANSDSAEDQQLKLKVRDAVIDYLTPQFEQVTSVSAARQIILEHRQEIKTIAQKVVRDNGADYAVDLQEGWFDFPVKAYGNLVLPAGKYEAVRILIGKAEGKNWWCVLFPPLCFIDAANATAVVASDGNKTSAQGQNTAKVEFRWKIAELWNNN